MFKSQPVKSGHYSSATSKSGFLRKSLIASLVSTCIAAPFANAAGFDANNYITGDWGGKRAELAEQGVNIRLGHFSQTAVSYTHLTLPTILRV